MIKSIFDIEKRTDFDIIYNRILTELNDISIINYFFVEDFWSYLNIIFPKWEYRDTAMTWQQYLEDIGISNMCSCDNEQKMYVLQFVCNVLDFVYNTCDDLNNYTAKGNLLDLKTTIIRVLEKINYQLYKVGNKIEITKRDADVDSILKSDQDINFCLLSYNDFRIKNNLYEKRQILKKLADYLEPKRSQLETLDKPTAKNVFYLFNNLKIRHNNNTQIDMEDDELLHTYDELFKLVIHLIRLENVKEINTKINLLKSKT